MRSLKSHTKTQNGGKNAAILCLYRFSVSKSNPGFSLFVTKCHKQQHIATINGYNPSLTILRVHPIFFKQKGNRNGQSRFQEALG